MKFIRFTCNNGYCGCDGKEYYIFPEDITEQELCEFADEFAQNYESMYDYIATNAISEDDYDTVDEYEQDIEDALEDYYEGVEGTYEELKLGEWASESGWSDEHIIDKIIEIYNKENEQ